MLDQYKEDEGVKNLCNTFSYVSQAKHHCKIPPGAAPYQRSNQPALEVLATDWDRRGLAGVPKLPKAHCVGAGAAGAPGAPSAGGGGGVS